MTTTPRRRTDRGSARVLELALVTCMPILLLCAGALLLPVLADSTAPASPTGVGVNEAAVLEQAGVDETEARGIADRLEDGLAELCRGLGGNASDC